ncbi:hypothetical protein PR048_028162 [Dryococelus australis]|uniref:Uncharacterized protein n=1 Tax=Dryococelus australis TaxID=614101 RepID=A0ABQ9GIH0_9NEOP|nr:hypothetical protein PR048_028162 [Dryococelus australis]
MRVIEVNIERRLNEKVGGMRDPRENPPTSGIVRHYFNLRKCGAATLTRTIAEFQRRRRLEIPEKNHRPAASSGVIPTFDLKNKIFELSIDIPEVRVEADYDLTGKILILPLIGFGDARLRLSRGLDHITVEGHRSCNWQPHQPPRGPDLNSLDNHLWGHLKALVYATRVDDLDTLRNLIVAGCETIMNTPGFHQRICVSMQRRVDAMSNITTSIRCDMEFPVVNGREIMYLRTMKADFLVRGLQVYLGNLFNGNKVLDDLYIPWIADDTGHGTWQRNTTRLLSRVRLMSSAMAEEYYTTSVACAPYIDSGGRVPRVVARLMAYSDLFEGKPSKCSRGVITGTSCSPPVVASGVLDGCAREGKLDSIPGGVTQKFARGIRGDVAVDRRVLSGELPFPPALSFRLCSILAPFHPHRRPVPLC